jgi:hypothetical protein
VHWLPVRQEHCEEPLKIRRVFTYLYDMIRQKAAHSLPRWHGFGERFDLLFDKLPRTPKHIDQVLHLQRQFRPDASEGHHEISNGVLLRGDLHTLFDRGYLGIDSDDLKVMVSPRIKERFSIPRV